MSTTIAFPPVAVIFIAPFAVVETLPTAPVHLSLGEINVLPLQVAVALEVIVPRSTAFPVAELVSIVEPVILESSDGETEMAALASTLSVILQLVIVAPATVMRPQEVKEESSTVFGFVPPLNVKKPQSLNTHEFKSTVALSVTIKFPRAG